MAGRIYYKNNALSQWSYSHPSSIDRGAFDENSSMQLVRPAAKVLRIPSEIPSEIPPEIPPEIPSEIPSETPSETASEPASEDASENASETARAAPKWQAPNLATLRAAPLSSLTSPACKLRCRRLSIAR
jgi:hypothetical protein